MGGRSAGRREIPHLHRRGRARFRAGVAAPGFAPASGDGHLLRAISPMASPLRAARSPVKVSRDPRDGQRFSRGESRLHGGRGIGRHAFRRTRFARAARRHLSRAGILRLDGFCGAGGARARRSDCGLRPIVLCGDGGFQMTGPEISHAPQLRRQPDRDRGQQRRLGHLPSGRLRSPRPARNPAVALRETRARTGAAPASRPDRQRIAGRAAAPRISARLSRSSMWTWDATICRR